MPMAHVLAVQVERDLARPLERGQAFDDGRQLHAVVGGVEFATEEVLLGGARLEPCAPAAGTGVALAGAVGVDLAYFVQEPLPSSSWPPL